MTPVKNVFFRKAWWLSWAIVLVGFSCRNESRENTSDVPRDDAATTIAEDAGTPLPSLPYIAAFDDVSEQLEVEKNPDFDSSLLTVDALTLALRTNYPEIELEIARVSSDTLFAQIVDAHYLTQQMGSSGAKLYIMEVTYAYTELPDIEVVHLDFEEGDHAIPGNYSRGTFAQGLGIR